MILSKLKKNAPDDARADLNQASRLGATPGQRILGIMIAVIGSVLILGGIGYKYLGPIWKGEQKPAEAVQEKPLAEVKKTSPDLIVPAELGQTIEQPKESADAFALGSQPQGSTTLTPQQGHKIEYKPCPPGLAGCGQQGQTAQTGQEAADQGQQGQGTAQPDQAKIDKAAALKKAEERKLQGDIGNFDADPAPTPAESVAPAQPAGIRPQGSASGLSLAGAPPAPSQQGNTTLGGLLVGTSTPAATATRIANAHLTLGKGTPITCSLNTAIMTDQAGFTSCVTDAPVYSMDGKVVLAERGTVIDAEYQRGLDLGKKAIFVLFTCGLTPAPHNVQFCMNSPGTDQLGRAGISGEVDSNFWARFQGAFMYSVLQDGLAVAASRSTGGSTNANVVLLPNTQSTGQNAVGEILKQGSDIKPTLNKNQGALISITVARNVDFSGVYRLKSRSTN